MTIRTSTTTVTFRQPFILSGFEQLQAAGTYTVDTEEEQIEAISFPVWKRISTVIRLSRSGGVEHRQIDPDELHEALRRDSGRADANGALDRR
ncbi:MAG TPA: hypothetical protein VEU47_06740 [Candidatus Cybelea sp.]|nr:hypothetical protein [Candidatus Cybelea sp.]